MEFLSNGFQKIINKIKGKKIIQPKHFNEFMEEIRLSLLQADVNYEVVESFNNQVKEKVLGQEVLKNLNPDQQIIKVLNETLIEILDSKNISLNIDDNKMNVFMMVGLQGSGKTTSSGKLSLLLNKKFNKKVMLIACDIYRPGAVDQLRNIGQRINIHVFFKNNAKVEDIVQEGLKYAAYNQYDMVIIDTAGTLSINQEMMTELKNIKKISQPSEILLVVDVLLGKEFNNVAKTFHQQIGTTGVILTKMDADTKGGIVLSVKKTTNMPIKLMSSSEKIEFLEVFDPKRMSSRILGMGDILTVIDKVTENIDPKQGQKMIDRLLGNDYNYYDLEKQLKMLTKMGSINKLLKFIPGISSKMGNLNLEDNQLKKFSVMIKSMTKAEKLNPHLISLSGRRRMRIAKGSGNTNKDVYHLTLFLEKQKSIAKQFKNFDPNNMDLQQDPNLILENILKNKK